MQTILVLGASYAGSHCAEVLAQAPGNFRVVLLDRQSHFNHLYLFPRLGVLPAHAHKAFIPYTNLLRKSELLCDTSLDSCTKRDHIVVHANVEQLDHGFVRVDRALTKAERGDQPDSLPPDTLAYDYLVYATGCQLPPPLISPSRTKLDGIAFLNRQQELIAQSSSILIVGGGALGIQYATDIADLYNNERNASLRPADAVANKEITLVHSRDRFLPLYKWEVHEAVLARLRELGVRVIFNARPSLPDEATRAQQEVLQQMNTIQVQDQVVKYDVLVPNSSLIGSVFPRALDSQAYVRILPTLQIDDEGSHAEQTFVIGDVAAAGVIKAGHTGWNQAEVAARNVLHLIAGTGEPLERYERSPPQIKVTLGLRDSVSELLPNMQAKETEVATSEDGPIEGYWRVVWSRLGVTDIGDALA